MEEETEIWSFGRRFYEGGTITRGRLKYLFGLWELYFRQDMGGSANDAVSETEERAILSRQEQRGFD